MWQSEYARTTGIETLLLSIFFLQVCPSTPALRVLKRGIPEISSRASVRVHPRYGYWNPPCNMNMKSSFVRVRPRYGYWIDSSFTLLRSSHVRVHPRYGYWNRRTLSIFITCMSEYARATGIETTYHTRKFSSYKVRVHPRYGYMKKLINWKMSVHLKLYWRFFMSA